LVPAQANEFTARQQIDVLSHAEPSTIVNLFTVIKDLAPGTCSEDLGLRYVVPTGKTLLVTDVKAGNIERVFFWTDTKGTVLRVLTATHLQTPLKVDPGEMLCLYLDTPGSSDVFLSGRLVDAAPGQLFTLLDRVDVAATATITSGYINLEGFSEFKMYFQMHNEVAKGFVRPGDNNSSQFDN